MTVLKTGSARYPDDRDSLLALISFSREAGDLVTALAYAQQLARIAPNDQSISKLVQDLQQQVKKPDPQ